MATLSGLDLRVGEEIKASTAFGEERNANGASDGCLCGLFPCVIFNSSWVAYNRLDRLTCGQFSDKENCVIEACMDGVQWCDSKNHTMTPLCVRCHDIPHSHRNTKVHPCNVDMCYDITKIRKYSLDMKVFYISGRLLAHRMMYAL